ncbi:hypothetical protein GALL_319110 [mine drainage metagenome]|uniref:Uncharacterized protein n=1 Tax=mine drainage metagenome TaxID=410659 RepID=A0A1J5QRI5_9ZZZZ
MLEIAVRWAEGKRNCGLPAAEQAPWGTAAEEQCAG